MWELAEVSSTSILLLFPVCKVSSAGEAREMEHFVSLVEDERTPIQFASPSSFSQAKNLRN